MNSPAPLPSAKYKWTRSEKVLIGGSSLSMLAILIIVAFLLARERADATSSAARTASNIVQLINADVLRNAELYDTSLQGILKSWKRPDLTDISAELRQLVLFDRSTIAPFKGDMVLLDKDGKIIADSLSVIPRNDNLSDRPYFQHHLNNPSTGLHVDGPFKTRSGNPDWCISLSRRMSGPNGEFEGVASGVIRLVYFRELFKSQVLDKGSSISIITANGTMLVRYPDLEGLDLTGKDYSASENFKRIVQEGTGSFTGLSSQFQTMRFFTFSRVGDLPLIVVIGQAEEEVYTVWRRNAWLVGSATGVLCIGIMWLTFLLCRELRRRHQAEDKLASLAATDGLTGLPNRRQLDDAMDIEWARAVRSGKPLSLLMVDVDHFKAFNERHGHAGGDEALRKVAYTISRTIRRPGDIAARYGGEEFVVVLPETDLQGAMALAESIRTSVEVMPVFNGDQQRITVSIGVASQVVQQGNKLASLFGLADKALYQAKNNGRNRVEQRVFGQD
ncbi:sensor domain-containing diguanylate cyclase [Pseudomonas lijiangensis]|uniref:sensor domain-containing diguanylate cyclase n=1 Tax=Pseudomonas syringae group TaxID=136849 RepID=UPI0018E62D2F|nr:sensor domain-containing diguanylate cyclase [Pseudomonas cichorii]MBI6855293.1 diguanylate cyclase [Pseudomonas cichorii]